MNCSLSCFDTSVCCSSSFESLCDIDRETSDIVLSEVGLLFCQRTKNFSVCNVHLEKILVKNRSKNKSVRCAIPTLLSHHKKTAPRAERNVTKDAMMKIHSSTGIVLAIGTPICSNCRKHLSSGKPDEHLEVSVPSEEISVETLSEIDYNKHLALNIDGEKREDKRYSSDSCTKLWNDHQKETVTDGESQTESESMCLETGDSQYSEASVCVMDKLQKLNSFLAISDVSPVKEKLIPLSSSTDKTKQRCLSKALECMSAICETICPGEGDLLFKSVISAHKPEKSSTLDQTALILRDIYISAETWSLRRQILSVLSRNYSFNEVREMIPDLTKYRFYAAKLHSDKVGCGLPVSKGRLTRNKIDIADLEHFIDFIISSDVVKDLPFGMKTMKLTTGEIVAVPNLIRSLAPSSLINQFIQFCDSENVGHLGRSTMYKILNDCAASVRKCVEGLDYYIAEGGKAFQDLETIIEKLCISSEKKKELKSKLLNGKRYIKSDFKVHIQRENAVPDHCQMFALSDSEKCFSQSCNTQHKHSCEQCIDLADFLAEISTLTQNGTWDNKDSIVFQVENAVEAIKDWKSHAMRARNQEGAKQDLLKNLNENQALITCDWAMKFLPRKFREGQSDWFGKRGINWHISVTLYKQGEELKTITHVHIFSSQISQDGSVTASVLCDVVHDLTKQVPNIQEVNFFSDNAGCYKNTMMMVALKDELGDKLKTYNFSEAQDGKGPCDRRASHIKACVRRYINEGHDVTSAEEMKQAIDVKQKGSFRVRVVDIVTNLDAEKSQIKPITGITQLHNFSFDVNGITVWKAYGIGGGKQISWDNIGTTEQRTNLLVKVDWTITAPQLLEVEVMAQEEELIEPNPKKQKKNSINQPYDCPKDGCTRAFKTQCALEQHIIVGNCDYHNEKTTQDKAKSMYGQKVNSLFHGTRVQLDCNLNDCRTSESVKGWALKGKKKRTVFSQSQVNYMKEKFDIGKVSGRKVDPFQAADEMRQLQEEGKYVFSRKDYLTGQQITAYFSRLALKDRKTDLEDFRSAEEETNKRCLKQEILDSVSL
ncbi:uncharacterized protein [Mytilus edulis]|uniref:uncharacterized protein n=1 Tax=Mytilus edulis TaxID=6550 RepID=UPI0039F09BA4